MRIVGVLSWFDESPAWLAAVAAGFGRVCDTIVAVDGAYSLYPGARARSVPEQAEAILAGAESVGAGCVIHRPREVWWGNEVEKRNHSLRLAGALCDQGDWLMVFDGDYQLMQTDADTVRLELENTSCFVASYTLLDSMDVAGGDQAELGERMALSTEWTFRTRDVFRWSPDLRYVGNHFWVSGSYEGRERHLKGPEMQSGNPHVEECCHLGASLVVYHRRAKRPLVRRQAADGYHRLRMARGIEEPLPEVFAE